MKWLFGKAQKGAVARGVVDEAVGIFLFDDVTSALKAEKVLKAAGYDIELVAPPQRLRAGCDLAIAIAAVERPGAERELASRDVEPRGWADTLEGTLELADIVTWVDFGEHLMVRAGNMKITVEKDTGRIVNTSGGGCPDIPFLNLELVGDTVHNGRRPRELGYTLCGLMLDRAFLEARSMVDGTAAPDSVEGVRAFNADETLAPCEAGAGR